MAVRTHLALVVSHRAPLGSREHALLCHIRLGAKHLLHQRGVCTDVLQEPEVRAERLLRYLRVLDVSVTKPARLALRSVE